MCRSIANFLATGDRRPTDVSGFDTVEVAKAWFRQMSRVKAKFLLAVLETGLGYHGGTPRRAG